MRADVGDLRSLAKLVRIIWPEHTPEELERLIRNYMDSDNSAVFSESANTDSMNFHLSIGFHEENRIICFKEML